MKKSEKILIGIVSTLIIFVSLVVIGLIIALTNDEPQIQKTVKEDTTEVAEEKELDNQSEGEANAELYPAKPAAMLYDTTESKFKGMNYYFKGTLIKVEKVEGLSSNIYDAFLVKNSNGYIMPIFPPYKIDVTEGDEIEVWGLLSGDGYASSDLGIDNVVGVAGAMNATLVNVNGEMK